MRLLTIVRTSRQWCHCIQRSFATQPVAPQHRIELVALDVDGTLLDACGKLHPRVKDSIVTADNLGIPILLSTGRCSLAAMKLINVGLDSPLPLSGGAFLGGAIGEDAFGKIRRDVKLGSEVVHRVLYFCEEHEVTPVLIGRNTFWCSEQNTWTQRLIDAGDPKPSGVGKRGLYRKAEKANLVCIMGNESVIENIQLKLNEVVADLPAHVVRPFGNMLDVVPVDDSSGLAGKAAALAELCSWRGISAESVMVVGDSGNDVDMMQWAGWAVAMGNASESAMTVANAVVARNTDVERPGVAEALEDFVINPMRAEIE